MEWTDLYEQENQPSAQQISQYIANPLWEELNTYLQDGYQTQPQYTYSKCSGQPGWNVKYQKSGRSLCTLYPLPGAFIALVVIGNKEQAETELLLPTLSEYTQNLYKRTEYSAMGRWLMIHVTDAQILSDVKQLIQIRRKLAR